MAKKMENIDRDEELREAFRVFDKEARGFISCEELGFVMRFLGNQLSEEDITEMLKEVDVDSNGRIKYEGMICDMYCVIINNGYRFKK